MKQPRQYPLQIQLLYIYGCRASRKLSSVILHIARQPQYPVSTAPSSLVVVMKPTTSITNIQATVALSSCSTTTTTTTTTTIDGSPYDTTITKTSCGQGCTNPMAQWNKLFAEQSATMGCGNDTNYNSDTDDSYSSCTTSSHNSNDEDESDEETAVAHAMVRAVFSKGTTLRCRSGRNTTAIGTTALESLVSRRRSFTALDTLLVNATECTNPPLKKFCTTTVTTSNNINNNNNLATCVGQDNLQNLRHSISEPILLHQLPPPVSQQELAEDDTTEFQQHHPPTLYKFIESTTAMKPDDFLCQMFNVQRFRDNYAMEMKDFFIALTPTSLQAYELSLVRAIRNEDLIFLQDWSNHGRSLWAGNAYGETILHAAARRGATTTVQFLLQQKVPIRVCCDYGRTVLHDACWTPEPVWDCLTLLLDKCPDLLYIKDRRGFTPLQYVPTKHWSQWCQFLQERGVEKLRPQYLQILDECCISTAAAAAAASSQIVG